MVPRASGSLAFCVGLLLVQVLSPSILPHPTAPPSQTPPWERSDLPSLLHCVCFLYILNSPILMLSLNFAFALKLSPLFSSELVKTCLFIQGFPGGSTSKEPACHAGATEEDAIPGLRRCPGEEQGNPLWYSFLEDPPGQRCLAGYSPQAAKSQTPLK